MIISSLFWYSSCERIYLRFYWNKEDISWHIDRNINIADIDDDEPTFITKSPPNSSFFQNYKKKEDKHLSFFTTTVNDIHNNEDDNNTSLSTLVTSSNFKKTVITEGYLSNKRAISNITTGMITMKSTKWKRQYFILFDNGCLYTYKNRADYRNVPLNPLYTRPIILKDTVVKFIVSSDIMRDSEHSESKYQASSFSGTLSYSTTNRTNTVGNTEIEMTNISANIFLFSIMSIRSNDSYGVMNVRNVINNENMNGWIFSCDTEEELLIWIDCLHKISPNSVV